MGLLDGLLGHGSDLTPGEVNGPLDGVNAQGESVRVAVRAISVNPVDWKLYGGMFGQDPGLLTGFGAEVAGTVDAVGDGVTSYGPGDDVVVRSVPGGAYVDHAVAPAQLLPAKPAGVAWADL